MYSKNPPRLKKRGGNSSLIYNLDRDLFALSLGDSSHEDSDLLYDSATSADNLAVVTFSKSNLIDQFATGGALGHRNIIGMVDEILHNIGQYFFQDLNSYQPSAFLRSPRTVSVGCAPFAIQYFTRSAS